MIPAAGLQGIVAFVQTVEAGSFTLAAKRMGSPNPLSPRPWRGWRRGWG